MCVDVITNGSDQGQLGPMVEQIRDRYDRVPGAILVDGGFAKHEDIDTVSGTGCMVYAPVQIQITPRSTATPPRRAAADGYRGSQDDLQGPGGDCRMCERRRGLLQFLMRGGPKVRTIALLPLWHATRCA
jgi:hypothetical protein